ncbi:WbqC family protein [Patescibacteria group bacterium]|nr:WbqC family protein [Patescibacteria group bacterium]
MAQTRLSVVVHQPNFLPRLKVLQKLAAADVWCVLDSVQYNPREWQNRARIVAVHGDKDYTSKAITSVTHVRLKLGAGAKGFQVGSGTNSPLRRCSVNRSGPTRER